MQTVANCLSAKEPVNNKLGNTASEKTYLNGIIINDVQG